MPPSPSGFPFHCLSSWLSPNAPCRKALYGRALHGIRSVMTDVACGITEIQCFSGMPHPLPRSATWQQHQQNTGQYTGERIKDSAPGMAQSQTSQSPWPTCARFELPFTGGQVGTRNSHTALQQDGNQPPARKVKAMLGILTGHTRGQKVPKGVNMTGLTALGPLTHFCAVERKILLPATSMETLWA